MKYLIAIILLNFSQIISAQTNNSADFLAKPYLQLGKKSSRQSLQLLWHAPVSNDVWLAEYKNSDETDWRRSDGVNYSTITIGNIPSFNIYSTSFTALKPGTILSYRHLRRYGSRNRYIQKNCL
jgi:hypothetical protein